MADIPKFTIGRRGGGATEQRLAARVATTDGVRNDAGYGRGNVNPPMAIPFQPPGYKPDSLRGSNDKVETILPNRGTNPASAQSETIKIDFQPNLLDNYDSYTYHWKLFITSLADASAGNVLEQKSQTIIAESGVTDLTIDKVEFMGIAVPSLEAGTGTQTLVKFEILEPAGAGLLDKMYYESLALGIGNWLVMPCFLQLEFKGRDPVSSEAVTNGAPDTLAGLRWVWPIKLTNCKAQVSSVGTRYDFEAVFYDELAQSNSYFSIQHNVVLAGLTKFGQAIDDLQNKLNADQYEKTLDNYSIPDTYKFVVDPELANESIALPDLNRHTSRAGDFIDFNKKTASYNTGTSIDKIVDSLLGSSDYYQRNLQSAQSRISEPQSADQMMPMRNLWRIVTETKPIAFDLLRQDNAVEITIFIVKYDLGLISATAQQTGQTAETLEAARKRLATYTNNRILRKRYNYIFTGLNDQIINFDLNMNFSFAATLSRFGGVYLDTATQDTGVAQRYIMKDEQEAVERVRKTLRFINEPQNQASVDIELAAAKSSISATNISAEAKARYIKILEKAKPADRTAYVEQIKKAGGLDADGELNRERIYAKSLANSPTSVPKFISDVNISSAEAKEARKLVESSRRGKLRPIPFREGVQENNLAFGIDPTSDAGRSRTSNIFSTALYSSLDASLVHVKLTIKGDPYWLFPRSISTAETVLPYKSNLPESAAIRSIRAAQIDNPSTVNLFGTDNFIVIRFRTPRVYNDNTGLTDSYSEVETFSGVYRVITITSKFVMGVFTQEVTGILDDLINLSDFPDFLRDLENSVKVPDAQLGESDPGLNPDWDMLPPTSIKADKIMGVADQIKGQVATVRDAAGNVVSTASSAVTSISSLANTTKSNIPSDIGFTASELLQRRLG